MKQAWWRRLQEFYNDQSPSAQVDNSEPERVGGGDSYTGDADIDTGKSSGEVATQEMIFKLDSRVRTLMQQVAILMKHNAAAAKVCLNLYN